MANNEISPLLSEKEPQTWAGHVLIPLVQNLLGGGAVAGLGLIAFIATQSWRNVVWYVDDASMWCLLAGGIVSTGFTIIRFFGDDVGLMSQVFRAGQFSRDAEVNALQTELLDAQRRIDQLSGVQINERQRDELIDRTIRSREHALEIVRRRLANEEYRRKQLSDAKIIEQKDWNRAFALLKQAGVIDDKNMMVRTVNEADRLIEPFYKRGLEIAKRRGRPAWLVA